MASKIGQDSLELPSVSRAIDWETLDLDMRDDWVLSTRDAIREIESATLRAEAQGASDEDLQRIRAHLHNMKGEAGFVGLDTICGVCHLVETELEDGDKQAGFRSDMLLGVVDWFEQVLVLAEKGEGDGDETPEEESETGKPRVLIVEDGVINRKLLENMLREVCECDVAADGEIGVSSFLKALEEERPYEVIFLDIMMPKMDGQAMLEKVREEESKRDILGSDGVKVIMTTALKDSKNVLGAFRQGCEGYLVKPIEKDELFAKLHELEIL